MLNVIDADAEEMSNSENSWNIVWKYVGTGKHTPHGVLDLLKLPALG